MTDAIGKTVSRVEVGVMNDYGRVDDGRVLIHFTDGTALSVWGSSYEEVSQSTDDLSYVEVRALEHQAQGQREVQRLKRLKREAYDALPQEEKDRREADRLAAMTPMQRAMHEMEKAMIADMRRDANRMLFGGSINIEMGSAKPRKARRS